MPELSDTVLETCAACGDAADVTETAACSCTIADDKRRYRTRTAGRGSAGRVVEDGETVEEAVLREAARGNRCFRSPTRSSSPRLWTTRGDGRTVSLFYIVAGLDRRTSTSTKARESGVHRIEDLPDLKITRSSGARSTASTSADRGNP